MKKKRQPKPDGTPKRRGKPIHCGTCGCDTTFRHKPNGPQDPPDPACGCECHVPYWMVQGEAFRREVAAGRAA